MTAPTKAQLERARAIAANMPGVNALQRCAFLDGEWDDAPVVQGALAAIIETQEAAARLAENIGSDYGMDETGWFDCTETVALQLRAGKHLEIDQ